MMMIMMNAPYYTIEYCNCISSFSAGCATVC